MQAVSREHRPGRRIRWIAMILLLLPLLGLAYEAVSDIVDLRRFPAPGQMVDMGEYALHLHCTGQGAPTVLLEAGLGGGVNTWPFVQPEVAKATRVCSYDRSGYSWSGGTTPQSGAESVARLHDLLQRAGESGPYVLVGHSLGGLYGQLYAMTYPAEVSGMVLVEARHQEYAERLADAGHESGHGPSVVESLIPVLNRLGVVRLVHQLGLIPGVPDLPPGMMEISYRPASLASVRAEHRILTKVEEEVRAANVALGEWPLVVVTRDPAVVQSNDSTIWLETQRQFLRLSSNSKLVEAKGSGHMVPYENPTVVTEAILEVVTAIRP